MSPISEGSNLYPEASNPYVRAAARMFFATLPSLETPQSFLTLDKLTHLP